MSSADAKPCWECFKKRRVCDFSRPSCLKCVSRCLRCPGYDQKPLKWLQPGQTRSKGRRAKDEAGQMVLHDSPTVPPSLPAQGTEPVQAAMYYNSMVCPDLEALGGAGEGSSYFVPLFAVAYMPPASHETMICTSLGHRLLQMGYNAQSKDAIVVARRLQTHRGNAMRFLSEMIANPSFQYGDQTLGAIVIFLLSDIQHSIAPTWSYHNEGAHALIRAQGGLRECILAKPNMGHLYRYFLLYDLYTMAYPEVLLTTDHSTDIMGATTTPHLTTQKTERQIAVIDLLKQVYGLGLITSVACDHYLIRLIVLINHQRALHAMERPSAAEAFSSMLAILDQIRAFSVEDWVVDISVAQASWGRNKLRSSEQRRESDPTWNWGPVGKAYQAAVALYCISSLADVDEIAKNSVSGAFHRVSEVLLLKESCRRSLLGNLKEIATDPISQLRKLVFWPVFMAGVSSDDDEDGARTFVLTELLHISRSLGTAAALIAHGFLEKQWASATAKHSSNFQTWDDLFDRPFIFAL
ncbi:hypothetical protein NLG97_g374 [Lecanicillium saksenae]|uniref:Uncharacterized protein n=1 Tax=Lecanicillium saksenae TaxID=468837 RepID=A0ACC1R8J4_9HYPO|nr:hypothetical protein NLG97_g374 [Lecanicillium saksenae]